MKKFAVVTTLIGVLALAACSGDEEEPGTQEPGSDQNQVEEDGTDNPGGADTEDADDDAE